MSRRHRAKKRIVSPDPYYDSILVHKFWTWNSFSNSVDSFCCS